MSSMLPDSLVSRVAANLARAPLAVFIMGPTASGKSGLALAAAEQLPVEILNADSVQIYRGFDLGSAKPSAEERRRVPHHLLDVAEADDPWSAWRYAEAARRTAGECLARGRLPLFVGGSGLYFRAVEQGLSPIPPIPPEIITRIRDEGERWGWPALHQRLQTLDPESARRLTPNDGQRIGRALSVREATGQTLASWQEEQGAGLGMPLLKLAPDWPRDVLYARIEARLDQMMAEGFLEEVRRLWSLGYDPALPVMKAVGYRQLFQHVRGEIPLDRAVALAKQESRRYAKRQWTWLRREVGVVWFAGDRLDEGLERLVAFALEESPAPALEAPFADAEIP
ncbi:MAG: tRNA (adenosine(37)-N6)-dimethylallyltransferase MiaA [Magnetococcales bacterium]|nr:tRNA (adenosine(37)-N6)-dimethylallyltransferase MiaA [Magnetococcales bacterium]